MNVTSVGVERSDRAAGSDVKKISNYTRDYSIGRSELRQLGEIAEEKRVRTEAAREMRRAAAERKRNAASACARLSRTPASALASR